MEILGNTNEVSLRKFVETHDEVLTPCSPNPCGANALCKEQNGVGACYCIDEYKGNPYEGCRPECVLNSDCPSNLACVNSKCKDTCPGSCGLNAQCRVVNHNAVCTCVEPYTGNAYTNCFYQKDDRKINFFAII